MTLPFHQLFTMASFEGLRLIRDYRSRHLDLEIGEIIALVERSEADSASMDFESARELDGLISDTDGVSTSHFYRVCIYELVLARLPKWTKFMTLGRRKFASKLNRDDQSIFRRAGLLDHPPSDENVFWWDDLTGRVRDFRDGEFNERARIAEKHSLEYEKSRLVELGLELEPEWVAIEDNTVGYDVKSYDWESGQAINRFIEVKSSVANPLKFIVSRNEWEKAEIFGEVYHFHIWDMRQEPPILHQKTVSQVAQHIPTDAGRGRWKNVEIPLSI